MDIAHSLQVALEETVGRMAEWLHRESGSQNLVLAGGVALNCVMNARLRDRGPFSLLFLDSGTPSEVGVDQVVDLVEPGGIVVLDDFAPCESWPPITYGRVDSLREQWLTDDRFTAVEVMVAADASAVIATRR